MNEDGDGPHPGMTNETLVRETMLALFAGADTTATSTAGVLFYLMTHPTCFQRLRAELDAASGGDTIYDAPIEAATLAGLKYLEAVINETLRLQPAVPTGVQRVPPADGGPVMVAGQYVLLSLSIVHDGKTFLAWSRLEPQCRFRHTVVSAHFQPDTAGKNRIDGGCSAS
jgi:cytochrome P450